MSCSYKGGEGSAVTQDKRQSSTVGGIASNIPWTSTQRVMTVTKEDTTESHSKLWDHQRILRRRLPSVIEMRVGTAAVDRFCLDHPNLEASFFIIEQSVCQTESLLLKLHEEASQRRLKE